MKAILCILLVLPAAAFSEPPDPPATVRVAVFDFQTDGSVEGKFGIKNTGETAMPSQSSRNSQAKDSPSSGGPIGSPMATQLEPEA